ncbi:hypothetical protein AAEU32_05625 [Pseudoalteromonas sp. SSDWG2]|uniref:hypothetical protein n=1 Tax=Pseudoalteromonas sp. SSDWG2 TaxID=3139391 RepID=UPI003BA981AB
MTAINLSRKAWNNIIIFAMLIMIFLFNGLHHKLSGDDEPLGPQPILPEQSYILALEYPGVRIERIGTSWRIQAEEEFVDDSTQLEPVILAWQNMQAELGVKTAASPMLVATLSLAGEPQPWVYVLYPDGQQYQLFDRQQQRWLVLSKEQAQQLFMQLEG